MSTQRGFTLIEILVGVALVGVVAGLISGVLQQTFKTDTKSTLLGQIKQNSQEALNLISQTIREADAVVCVGDTVLTVIKDGVYSRIKFYPQSTTNPRSNGYIAVDHPTPSTDPGPGNCPPSTFTSSDLPFTRCSQTFCLTDQPTSSRTIITDTNLASGVSILSPAIGQYFSINSFPGSKSNISVSFSTSPGIDIGSDYEKTLGTSNKLDFSTTIELR